MACGHAITRLAPQPGCQQSPASWRATAWVHGSEPHLWRNLAGVALIAAMGWTARVGPATTLAWLLAWPLTHMGMLWRPELTSYVGLSGVLHAGAAIVALHQIITPATPGHGGCRLGPPSGPLHQGRHGNPGGRFDSVIRVGYKGGPLGTFQWRTGWIGQWWLGSDRNQTLHPNSSVNK